jgi:hypothetical protein
VFARIEATFVDGAKTTIEQTMFQWLALTRSRNLPKKLQRAL